MQVTLHRHRQYFHLHRKSKKDISSYYRFIRAWTHQCKRIELPNHKKFTFAPMPPLVEKIGQLDLNQFEHEVNLIMNATCKTTKIEGNFAYGKLPRSSPARAHCNEVYQEPRKNGKQAQQALETFFNVVKTTYNCDATTAFNRRGNTPPHKDKNNIGEVYLLYLNKGTFYCKKWKNTKLGPVVKIEVSPGDILKAKNLTDYYHWGTGECPPEKRNTISIYKA